MSFRLEIHAQNITGYPRHFWLRAMRRDLEEPEGEVVLDLTGAHADWLAVVEIASGDQGGQDVQIAAGGRFAFEGDVPALPEGLRWHMLPLDRAAWRVDRLRINGVERPIVTTLL